MKLVYNIRYKRERLRDIVEKEVRKEKEESQIKEEADLTPQDHERALKGAYKSSVVPRLPKPDINCYFH